MEQLYTVTDFSGSLIPSSLGFKSGYSSAFPSKEFWLLARNLVLPAALVVGELSVKCNRISKERFNTIILRNVESGIILFTHEHYIKSVPTYCECCGQVIVK